MCKKMLSSLMGGGEEPAAPAQPAVSYSGGKEAEVKGDLAGGPSATGPNGKPALSGGVIDPKKRKAQGVPGLGL